MATSIAVQQEALTRAVSSQSLSNYATIIRGFMAKGLAESAISPRENVFTYNAWKALGRQVKKGEHGVKCLTFITQRNKRTGREEKRPWTTTVFHVSQTEPVGTQSVRLPQAPNDMPCYNGIIYGNEPDATPENVPFAGEDEASRESGLDDAIAAHIQAPILSIEKFHADLEADGARFEHVKTDEVDYLLTTPESVKTWEERVQALENEGLTRSDAQAVIDAEDAKNKPEQSFISHPDTWKAAPVNTAELDAFAAAQPYKKYCEKCGSDDLRHPADILCRHCRVLAKAEVIPAPVPKESAYNRAMRGETVSIMDIIDDLSGPKRASGKQLPRRLQSASFSDRIQQQIDKSNGANRKPFQTKTVEF